MPEADLHKKRPRWRSVVLPWANTYKTIDLPKRNLLGHQIEKKMYIHSLGSNRLAEVSVHQTIKKNLIPFLPFLGGKTARHRVKNYEIKAPYSEMINGVEIKYYRHNGRVLILDTTKDPRKHQVVTFIPNSRDIFMVEPHVFHVRSVLPQA